MHIPSKAVYFRNFIYGVEDSLVSTVGLLSGVAVASSSRPTIFLAGIVLIFVEAFSMGAGSFLSEHSEQDFLSQNQGGKERRRALLGGIVMFASYFIAGFIPLAPYLLFNLNAAFWIAICAALLALLILGIVSGKITGVSKTKSAFRMLTIGGIAILLGVVVGQVVQSIM